MTRYLRFLLWVDTHFTHCRVWFVCRAIDREAMR